MRISTKGRGIIRAQQGAVARPNPKENYKLPDIPASSMVVYPIAGAIRNVALFGNSVIGSNTYVAFLLNNAKNMNYYSNYETDKLIIGTTQNIPVTGLLAVMCINNT